jgi:hypothetical protein
MMMRSRGVNKYYCHLCKGQVQLDPCAVGNGDKDWLGGKDDDYVQGV